MASGHTTLEASLLVRSAKLSNMLRSVHEISSSLRLDASAIQALIFLDSSLATNLLVHVSPERFVLSCEFFRSLFSLQTTLLGMELAAV